MAERRGGDLEQVAGYFAGVDIVRLSTLARMHQSRLAAIGIDCPSEVHDATRDFWSGALGTTTPSTDTEGPYTSVGQIEGRQIFVQMIDGDARVHLDIETDDVEAEVSRLEALGAQRVRAEPTWWIMRDPSGQPFCVVPPQSHDFPNNARTWTT